MARVVVGVQRIGILGGVWAGGTQQLIGDLVCGLVGVRASGRVPMSLLRFMAADLLECFREFGRATVASLIGLIATIIYLT